ncbi:MAG TPA: T9SS type A sorting domain-containing protein [bacterium]|nr:T9SS type A sorting domain-containing protein [bacterium]HQJ65266.1 T9SS type A sorting domain-containing protein [bacterium]
MKKLPLLATSLLVPLSIALSQTLNDYVSEVRGDTLVIKDYYEMGRQSNSLYQALFLDSVNVPPGRVYLLKANGYYPLLLNPTTRRPTTIVGADSTILVNNKNPNSAPPLICGSNYPWGSTNAGGINVAHDITVKNCNIIPAASADALGWVFFYVTNPNCKVTLQNNLFERTRWTIVTSFTPGLSLFIRDCYIVNLGGQPCRRSGGVCDMFSFMDTLLVENTTHVNIPGWMYKLRQFPFNRVVFNHNTLIDCAGYVFMDLGYQINMSTTNNIFVNCNVQAYSRIPWLDMGEHDTDLQSIGLVNVQTYPANDTTFDRFRNLPRKYLFENNVVYWDPRLADMVHILDSLQVNGQSDWADQMVITNQRTTAMFNNKATYPHFKLGQVYTTLPTFTDTKDLLTSRVDLLKAFALSTVDTLSMALLPDFRIVSTGPNSYIHSDWPIQVDLSYSDAALLTGATGGYPVGDLNWFPVKKAEWLAQRSAEYAAIDEEMGVTNIVHSSSQPVTFELQQNYPNPFNSSTTIAFSLPQAGRTTLKVFNSLGQVVATLVDGYAAANAHVIQFNTKGLASGIYFYKLESSNRMQMRKLIIIN